MMPSMAEVQKPNASDQADEKLHEREVAAQKDIEANIVVEEQEESKPEPAKEEEEVQTVAVVLDPDYAKKHEVDQVRVSVARGIFEIDSEPKNLAKDAANLVLSSPAVKVAE